MSDTTIQHLFDLTGQVALITGASGHLGSALASGLAEAGATVVCASRDLARAQKSADRLPTTSGRSHHAVKLNHLEEDSIQQGFTTAVELAGQVDILVNNGHAADGHDLNTVTAAQFDEQLRNATGYFLLARELRNHVVSRNGKGCIVMLGSMYGVVGSYPDAYADICAASPVHYHTLKGGIVQLTRHLAVYWAQDKIRVNCLSPGPFPSDKAPAELVTRLCERSPLKRMGQPHELKGALLLLASEAGSYITGQNLLVDGGWTSW